ncbi:MAG: HAMP domain-containing sensor histidine kinase [Gammaproteobacteria bacterium]
MLINSLNALNRSIKNNILLSLVSLLALSLLILNVIYYNNTKAVHQQNNYEIVSNFDLLKSHLSEKISIIASSSTFVDYLRSGSVSQQSLKNDFIFDIRSIKLKEISGMKIESEKGNIIFSNGVISAYFVDLPLCYFDRGLDSKLGDCSHHLILYLDKNEIIKSLQKINDNLTPCNKCTPIDFLSKKTFGSFKVANASSVPLFFEIKKFQNFNILTVNSIFLLFMVVLASWTWRRTNYILDKYISDPLKQITSKLKSGGELTKNDEIDELAYLVDQIQEREIKLKLAKENENLVLIGQIAAHVAHDMLSPLAVINIIVKQAMDTSKQERILMDNAHQQLSDIADNLLALYSGEVTNNPILNSEINMRKLNLVSVLLDSIIAEKRTQYHQSPININYYIEENAKNISANVSAVNFKRVISNIINNAVEAINGSGDVTVHLSLESESSVIRVTDSGIGMPPTLISKILNGESFSSKRGGFGIGLASSYKYIQSWGGQLDIASQPGLGTTVSIYIPELQYINHHNHPDLILIDDNISVIEAWKFAAAHKKKKIVVFNNLDDVERDIKNFNRAIPIYIDSNLGGAIKGEQYAKSLYEHGFINIYLTTGYKKSSFEPMYWIKGIIGKDFIFE